MLQTLREKTSGWIAAAILGALIVPFAFFGVNNYFSTQIDTWTAKVGDVEISPDEFRSRFDDYRRQMRQMMGEAFDPRTIETPEVKKRLLERMIDEELLRQAGARLGMTVAAGQMQREIAGIEAFQKDGKFDIEQYKMLLATQNMTPRSFEERVRRDLDVRMLPTMIAQSALVTGADVDAYIELRDQTRDLRYLELDAPAANAVKAANDEQIQAYYDQHVERFRSEEQLSLEYLELDTSKIEVAVSADESTLRQRYEEQSARFVEPEQRLASHILIKVAADADAAAQQAAQSKAQDLVSKVREPSADFAALARENSEDPGSKTLGGDLGWLEKGITDPAFESALFALEAGKISEPVKSADGWHVIQLREIRPGKTKPFEEVRADLEHEFLETERERAQSDLAGQLVDIIARDPTTLRTAATELKLEIKQTAKFGRAGGADPVSAHPNVIKAAFSESVLQDGNASDAIDIGGGKTVVVKRLEHSPAAKVPLAEVKDQVAMQWLAEQRANVARAAADAALERLKSGDGLDAIATDLKLSIKTAEGIGRNAANLDAALASAAFKLAPAVEKKSEATVVALDGERFALLQVTTIHNGNPASIDPQTRKSIRQQLAQVRAEAETEAFLAALRSSVDVQVVEERM